MEIIGDPLRIMTRMLEAKVAAGTYNRADWQHLLQSYENQGRESGAAAIRSRMVYFETQVPKQS